jgi:hypothetical protein
MMAERNFPGIFKMPSTTISGVGFGMVATEEVEGGIVFLSLRLP